MTKYSLMLRFSFVLFFISISSCSLKHACTLKHEKKETNSSIGDNHKRLTPIMGWSSWNHFWINIDERMVREQAAAMVSSGMKDAGYEFVNIDDGYFGGRDNQGRLLPHPVKFPSGMRALSDYIHSKGFKAGIYSDAGINTCASLYNKDTIGSGVGLYGFDNQDLSQMLIEWNFDFIKVDWCGAKMLGLDEEIRYSQLIQQARIIRPDVVFNICSWKFPGNWAVPIADSWRMSGDIKSNFTSILKIIDLNADLWQYCTPGHFNDMDMLQVGRGMTYDEDKSHFTMWCMMNTPLLAGNDLRDMSEQTVSILTNKDVIELNQDKFCYQARRLIDYGDEEVWAKPLISSISGEVAVALLNRSDKEISMNFLVESIGIDASKGYVYKDLWENTVYEVTTDNHLTFKVKPHGVVALRIKGTSFSFNVFHKK